MFQLQEPYAQRPICFLDLWQPSGWRLKVYGIAYRREAPRPGIIERARTLIHTQLPALSRGSHHYGVGFAGIHDGRGSVFVFLDFWADENELHHHVFVSPAAQPERLENVTATGLSACVWDLRVLCFERNAWVETVLANPAGPSLEAYLARRLNEDV